MRADFKAFLLTGAIKNLRVGSAQAEVIDALGEPDDRSAIKPEIWKYGSDEITFRDGRIASIALSEDATAGDVLKTLAEERVEHEREPELSYDTQTAFRILSSDVLLTLQDDRPVARAFAT